MFCLQASTNTHRHTHSQGKNTLTLPQQSLRQSCMSEHTRSAPLATICQRHKLISKNLVIMKYVIGPPRDTCWAKGQVHCQGSTFGKWMKLVCCSRTPECSRWLHGGVDAGATLKGSCSPHFNFPAVILVLLWDQESCQATRVKSTSASTFTF